MRIIVCDDDKNMSSLIRQWTKEYLEGKAYQFICCETGLELLSEMKDYRGKDPQIVFMDIKLKNDNGIEIARILNKSYGNIFIIFISGYTEYFEDSFEADPIYFLIKPIKKETFKKAMDKAIDKISHTKQKSFFIMQDRNLTKVFVDDIHYAESSGRKIRLYGKFGKLEYYEKMDLLEQQLGKDFIRCHKSFLVHMKYIHCVDRQNIIMMDQKIIPISKKKVNDTKKIIFQYLEKKL